MGNIFKNFSNCLQNKDYDETHGFNSYIFCKYLRSSPQMLMISNIINFYYKYIPDKSQFTMVRLMNNKPKYIKFIGSANVADDDTIDLISKKYKISKQKAREYNEILTKYKANNGKNICD